MANLIRNIGAFPNAIQTVVVCFFKEDFSYPLKILSHRVRKKVGKMTLLQLQFLRFR